MSCFIYLLNYIETSSHFHYLYNQHLISLCSIHVTMTSSWVCDLNKLYGKNNLYRFRNYLVIIINGSENHMTHIATRDILVFLYQCKCNMLTELLRNLVSYIVFDLDFYNVMPN